MKKNILKLFSYTLVLTTLLLGNFNYSEAAVATKTVEKPVVKSAQSNVVQLYTPVSPLDVVCTPSKYLNKNIKFNAEFIAFSSLGLDYKPAFRDSAKYIGLLIKRDDTAKEIPLSEMKIFMTRELAEKNVDLEAGDKISVSGKVFSTALGDPWVDVNAISVISKKNKPVEKNK